MASGIVIGLIGLWILLRTISTGNQGGGNLTDWLMNLGGNSGKQPASTQQAATQPRNVAGQPPPIGVGARPQGPNVAGGVRT